MADSVTCDRLKGKAWLRKYCSYISVGVEGVLRRKIGGGDGIISRPLPKDGLLVVVAGSIFSFFFLFFSVSPALLFLDSCYV